MRTFLEKAHDICSIGTFIFTIVIVFLMVIPMLRPSQPTQSVITSEGKPVIGWIMPSILAFCLLLAGLLNLLASRTRHGQPAPPAQSGHRVSALVPLTLQAPLSASGRIPTNAAPGELAAIWKHNTAVQAKKLSECYIGTWMTVSGTVYNVKKAAYGMRVTLDSVQGVSIVPCTFPEELEQRCSVLRKGDVVNVLGKVSDFDEAILSLEDCEFI
jgi:hypothetical protein